MQPYNCDINEFNVTYEVQNMANGAFQIAPFGIALFPNGRFECNCLWALSCGTTSLTNFFTIRWADRISMRVELYGCEYIPDVLHFNGQSMIKRDMSSHPVASLRDTLRLRFKTNHENGVLFYSKGSQGDYMALQLVENR